MKNIWKLVAVITLAAVMLTGCGGSKSDRPYDGEYYYSDNSAPQDAPAFGGYAYTDEMKAEESYDYDETTSMPAEQGLILTFSASIDMETLDFESTMAALREEIRKYGAYISSEHRNGGYTSYGGNYINQSAELVIKVPASNFHSFVDGINTCGSVRSTNTWQEDITSGYLDTQARLESLNAQKERLLQMMEQAENVSDLILIESQLSDTIYQIESYTSQMKVYQNLADYSSVTVYLNEVNVVTSNPVTFGQRVVETFKRTGRGIVTFAQDLVLGLIECLPLIALGVVLFFVIRKAVKAHKAKKQREYEEWVKAQQASLQDNTAEQN